MSLESKKYLFDILQACERIHEFTAGKSFESYSQDAMMRSKVERQLEIVGEALGRIVKLGATIADRITDHRRIIAFRNILVHSYAQIDNRLVWSVVEANLTRLMDEISGLLDEGDEL